MPSKSERGRLPFEPRQNKTKKSSKKASSDEKTANKTAPRSRQTGKSDASLSAIPDSVSKRMARRMVVFCGVPSFLGMSSLFIFYWLSIKDIVDLPPYLALVVSFAFLVVGIGGLSYGIFSASWDENRVGSLVGVGEFKTNLQRTFSAWRENRRQAKEN
ncbi:PAM68 family protein [Myxosarcina sp. GI1]|uniref:PAM68 family protein n=1 Tax=Myxosarcina sp. GI1 TaxID=1541065 RepID=UPI00056CC448|nr:PAM68 family protein [Myxosarcina sp. GI1]